MRQVCTFWLDKMGFVTYYILTTYCYSTENTSMTDFDEQDKRIAKILHSDQVPNVTSTTLKVYLDYLKAKLKFPCHLSGTECFTWEERFIFGHGNKTEYEKLKKTQPSYRDTFEALNLDDEIDGDYGVFVNVKRVSDKKKFTLPLVDLEVKDKLLPNHQLIDDFSMWFVNNR